MAGSTFPWATSASGVLRLHPNPSPHIAWNWAHIDPRTVGRGSRPPWGVPVSAIGHGRQCQNQLDGVELKLP